MAVIVVTVSINTKMIVKDIIVDKQQSIKVLGLAMKANVDVLYIQQCVALTSVYWPVKHVY